VAEFTARFVTERPLRARFAEDIASHSQVRGGCEGCRRFTSSLGARFSGHFR
jgi:hypothetical protein